MAFLTDDIGINTILGLGSMIQGDIKINGFARIDGDLDGNLESPGKIIIGANARIRGNITAKAIDVNGGIIQGNIIAPESVFLGTSSVVIGNIQTKHLKADDKSVILGHCISLSNEEEYNQSSERWQNEVAITNRSILSNMVASENAEKNSSFEKKAPFDPSKPRGLFGAKTSIE